MDETKKQTNKLNICYMLIFFNIFNFLKKYKFDKLTMPTIQAEIRNQKETILLETSEKDILDF